jgi:preprotein translocase subunit SecA
VNTCSHISVQGCYCLTKQEGKSYFICRDCNHTSSHDVMEEHYIDKLQDKKLICPTCGSKAIRFETYAVNHKSIMPNRKVGRNEPCPCGSDKKYKKCCGKI